MRTARITALAAVSLLLAACAGSATPNWTYAPASSGPAASGSAGASGSPGASGSAAASGSPAASGSAAASGGGGATVEIVASGIQFTTTDVTAPAGKPFTITFKNEDAGTPHNVDIKDPSGAEVAKTDIFNGVADKSLDVKALSAGKYTFVCDVHPNMTGTLTVQ